MRTRPLIGWTLAVIAIAAVAGGLVGSLPLAAQQGGERCAAGPNALGVSRVVEIDATTGPRFGGLQTRDNDFLKEGEVVLTFDDGPHPTFTPKILAALDAQCTKATFFVLGQRALSFPAQLREVGRRGHTIGTHTWSHANLGRASAAQIEEQIELGISGAQFALDGPTAPFFRFPYLSNPERGRAYLRSREIADISIDVDSNDFRTKSPTRMISNVLRGLEERKKGIILFHDIQQSTAHGIDDLLAELKKRGYRVVHIRPKQSQSTVAAYDQRIERQRGQPSRVATSLRPTLTPTAHAEPLRTAAPPPAPAAAPARSYAQPDWRDNIFGRW